jgi:hypothetical protein
MLWTVRPLNLRAKPVEVMRKLDHPATPIVRHARQQQATPVKDPDRWQRRLRAFAALGGACVCCGEREPLFLSIDHVRGRHTEGPGLRCRGDALIRWLERCNYQHGGRLRLLCLNCHNAITWTGSCPHQQRKDER